MKFLDVFSGCSEHLFNPKENAIVKRLNILNYMNELIKGLNDEHFYYTYWIPIVPDEATKDDLKDCAEDKELFAEIVERFFEIMDIVYNDELD